MTTDLTAPAAVRLEVSGLTVSVTRSKAPVVANIDLSLGEGQVLALVGESGSGKSTTGLALLGWARKGLFISGGSVLIDGSDVLSLTESELRSARGRVISYVPQDPSSGLNPALRVGTQLREALTNHPAAVGTISVDDRLKEMLDEVGLPAEDRILRSYPHQLSGGQQQRIAIAMAFACRPRVVVLDEPTTGLDVTTQRRVLETVGLLTKRYGSSAIYVSHDLAVVANIADQTAVMYAGRVVELGTTTELFRAPKHHYTLGLLAAIPDIDRPVRLLGIDGRPPRPGQWPLGCAFAERCSAARDDCRSSLPSLVPAGDRHSVRCLHPVDRQTQRRRQVELIGRESGGTPLVVVKGIRASFGNTEVLKGIDLEVSEGECTAIVGESGSGKTTLARCLVGLNSRWDGTLHFSGSQLSPAAANRTRDERRRIQYVFQNPYASLNPRMSIGQNIEEPLRFFRDMTSADRDRRICETLEEVSLSESYYERFPDQLSGGERQRAAIARALVVDPDLLVCDEVTSALDVSVQAQVVERLRQLQADRGLSMLFITHNLAVVRSVAQNVVVISQGQVFEAGPTGHVLDNPKHEYTKRLMKDLPRLPTPEASEAVVTGG
jgi:peptide/nickel transport system ATP-binding protein